jgi:exodeoxyribonuclease-3
MKIACWNVNSLKVRLPHLADWLAREQPDVVCLQETRPKTPAFRAPTSRRRAISAPSPARRPTTAWPSCRASRPTDVQAGIPGFDDDQKRVIAATVGDVRIVCAYFPNGQAVGSEKFDYKMRWLAALTDWLRDELARHPKLALLGDYNIAPEPRDAHPDWKDEIHVSPQERAAFAGLLALGLADAYRLFEQPEQELVVVGLPRRRLPPQLRPAHRPHPAVGAARRNAAPRASSTRHRASSNVRPTTRRWSPH